MSSKYITFFALLLVSGAIFLMFVKIGQDAVLPLISGAILLDIIGDLTGK